MSRTSTLSLAGLVLWSIMTLAAPIGGLVLAAAEPPARSAGAPGSA